MLTILTFMTIVVVFWIDPFTIAACAAAAYLPQTWRGVLFSGLIAGIAMAIFAAVILNMEGRPFSMLYAVAHVVSCIVGAPALRRIARAVRSRRTAPDGTQGKPDAAV